jgi:tetratricopeptide (TPR) repeat protein
MNHTDENSPEPSKVLVTSHDAHQFHQAWTLRLAGLMEDDALDLISYTTQKLDLLVPDSTEINDLLSITHGNPQAIATTLGNVKSSELNLRQALDELGDTENTLDYFLTRSWSTLERFPDAQRVLLAASLFEGSASKEALGRVARIDDTPLEKALASLADLSLIEVYSDEGKRQVHYGLHPLIHAFADTKLKERSDWEQEARVRWIDWWLEFTKVHGGPDKTEEWTEHYGLIDEERVNLSLVWEWCVAHGQYDTLQAFWHSERLLWMTSIYGCWKFRLTWLRRITKAAEKRGDKATALEAMVEQGFTLTQMGRIEEAGEMLKEAWKQNHFLSLGVQTTLAENLVQWYMRTNNFAGAQYWLEEANRRVRNLGEVERPRHSLTIQYYFGVVCIAKGDRKQAEMYFQETFKGAQKIGWQHCMIYVEQFLADIAKAPPAIFSETEDLKTDTETAGKDRGYATYYKYSLAYLALLQLRQNNKEKELNKVRDWAQQILKGIKLKAQPKMVRRLKAAPSSPFVVCFASYENVSGNR